MFQQEIMQKKQQIEQLEKRLKQGYDNEFIANRTKNALEVKKNELKELERMQKEYDLGIFDLYQYKYQEALCYFIKYANSKGITNRQQRDDFFEKSMTQWKKENAGLKTLMLIKRAFFMSPPTSKNLFTQKVLKAIESLQGYLKQKPLYATAQARQVVEC